MAGSIRLIQDVTNDIEVAASLGERKLIKHGFRLLGDVMADATYLIQKRFSSRPRMSASHEEAGKHWQNGTPPEIVEDMRFVVRLYQAYADSLERTAGEMDEDQARGLDRRRIQYLRQGRPSDKDRKGGHHGAGPVFLDSRSRAGILRMA